MMKLSDAFELFDTARYGLVSEKTRTTYDQRWAIIVQFLGDVEVEAVTIHDLRNYRRFLLERTTKADNNPYHAPIAGKLSVTTVHGYLKGCRRIFNWLHDEGVITSNPAKRLEIPRRADSEPKAISSTDFQLILNQARQSNTPERDTALVLMLADTGCRAGGLAGLQLADLDISRNRARVKEKGQAGGKWRYIYYSDYTAQYLTAWLDVRPAVAVDNVFITLCAWHHDLGSPSCPFCKKRNKPMTVNAITQLFKRLGKRAGVTGPHSPHSLRHAAAKTWIENGADLSYVSRLLGHTSIGITFDFYVRWSNNELAKCHANVSQFKEVQP